MAGGALLARLRGTRGWRLLIVLAAVPAILIGLLAMHVLTTAGTGDTSASATMATHDMSDTTLMSEEPGATNPTAPSPAGDCGGFCGPSHDMLGMICVLALLVTVVLLSLHLILIRWEELRRIVTTLAANAAALAPPAPPSLHVLSISRT